MRTLYPGISYPISVPHPVDVVLQFLQFGGEVGEAVEARTKIKRRAAPPAAADSVIKEVEDLSSEEGGGRHPGIFVKSRYQIV